MTANRPGHSGLAGAFAVVVTVVVLEGSVLAVVVAAAVVVVLVAVGDGDAWLVCFCARPLGCCFCCFCCSTRKGCESSLRLGAAAAASSVATSAASHRGGTMA